VRKYLYLATAAASVAVLAAPLAASATSTTGGHVLTVGKAGGNAVKTGAVLKASLAKGTAAVFSMGSGSAQEKLTCKSATFTAKVTANPARPGKATESLTAQTISKCSTNVMGLTVKKAGASNLPYKVTVSDAKGHPVTVAGTKKTKPVKLFATASFDGHAFTCTYKATSLKATSSNKGNSIAFSKQKFTKLPSSNGLCPASALFSATFGPVKDTSVKGNPAVFVN
jgi:hypothetical protein